MPKKTSNDEKFVMNFFQKGNNKLLKKQCAVTSWNKAIPERDTHTHYCYRLKFKER